MGSGKTQTPRWSKNSPGREIAFLSHSCGWAELEPENMAMPMVEHTPRDAYVLCTNIPHATLDRSANYDKQANMSDSSLASQTQRPE